MGKDWTGPENNRWATMRLKDQGSEALMSLSSVNDLHTTPGGSILASSSAAVIWRGPIGEIGASGSVRNQGEEINLFFLAYSIRKAR